MLQAAESVVAAEPTLTAEYVSISSCFDGRELEMLPSGEPSAMNTTLASIAVRLGSTRLIDNILLH